MPDKIYIYGDSLLKATVPDGDFHYHFHINEVMQRYQTGAADVSAEPPAVPADCRRRHPPDRAGV